MKPMHPTKATQVEVISATSTNIHFLMYWVLIPRDSALLSPSLMAVRAQHFL